MGWKLTSDALDTMDKLVADSVHDPVGPEFMAPPEKRPA
jgi:hypothetical protein